METYSARDMAEAGLDIVFVQDNQSCSTKGVLRGLHFSETVSSDKTRSCNDEGGMAWNNPSIGIVWPGVVGSYSGSASASGYSIDGVPLRLSDKDQMWKGLSETFRF